MYQDSSSSNIKFTPGKDSSSYKSRDDVEARPAGDPRSGKDFKKILGNEDEDEKKGALEESDSSIASSEQPSKSSLSLFDLSGGKVKEATQHTTTQGVDSPSALFAKISSKGAFHKEKDLTENDKFTTKFDTPQADLSYIAPPTPAIQQGSTSFISQAQEIPKSNIQDIINQLVEKLSQLEMNGKTDTTVTLKHPPLFAGANLIVSAFDTAKGEFNLSFANLTQAAQRVLDLKLNQDSLRLALEQKGYMVHIITTTTLVENASTLRPETSSPEGRENQRDQEDDRKGKREGRNT